MMEDTFNCGISDSWAREDAMIKVIGVGGGGCNAVNYMFQQKVKGCTFIVCNTDAQTLRESPVPVKIQIGNGRGCGTDPLKGRNAAIEAGDQIASTIFSEGTEMLFITAGMGGGTGTGAAPVIAKMAKDKGLLTVAVVTLPFRSEGNESLGRAIDGLRDLEKNVDSLLVINNEKLYDYFGDQLVQDAFPKADEVLATAVRGIVDIIQSPGKINVDFADIKKMMTDSGVALMGCGSGKGENRIDDAVREVFESPLLNDFDLKSAKNVLVNITLGENSQGLTMKQLGMVNDKIAEYTGNANSFKRGLVMNPSPDFGDALHITAIATGLKFIEAIGDSNSELGHYIVIDSNFVYEGGNEEGEISIKGNFDTTTKIGAATRSTRRFYFDDREPRPALAVEPGENISEYMIPAIRRMAQKKEQWKEEQE